MYISMIAMHQIANYEIFLPCFPCPDAAESDQSEICYVVFGALKL